MSAYFSSFLSAFLSGDRLERKGQGTCLSQHRYVGPLSSVPPNFGASRHLNSLSGGWSASVCLDSAVTLGAMVAFASQGFPTSEVFFRPASHWPRGGLLAAVLSCAHDCPLWTNWPLLEMGNDA